MPCVAAEQGGECVAPSVATAVDGSYSIARSLLMYYGPVWRGGQSGEPDLLRSAYRTCLELAMKHGCESIAFPAISCGVYGYPIEEACKIAIDTTLDFLAAHPGMTRVVLVLFSENDRRIYADYRRELA